MHHNCCSQVSFFPLALVAVNFSEAFLFFPPIPSGQQLRIPGDVVIVKIVTVISGPHLSHESLRHLLSALCLPGIDGEEWGKFLHTKNKVRSSHCRLAACLTCTLVQSRTDSQVVPETGCSLCPYRMTVEVSLLGLRPEWPSMLTCVMLK